MKRKETRMRVSTKATLSIYGPRGHYTRTHRIDGKVNPVEDNLSVITANSCGYAIFDQLLEKLAKKGARPGTHLQITIETVR